MSPENFGLSQEEFSDEASQDCYCLEKNTWAIQRDFAARVISENEVVLVCEADLGDGFYNFLRWFISEKLMANNKYVLHASCVLGSDQMAHIFLGHSGAGKTTVTRLSEPRPILGDDMNIISFNSKDELVVEAGAIGGLFNSMIGYDKLVKVKAIYWLSQSIENKLIRLDSATALQKLMASFANLNWPDLAQEKEAELIDVASRIIQLLPVYQMEFKKDASFWKMIE